MLSTPLTEKAAIQLAAGTATPPDILGLLSLDTGLKDSYKLKLTLCKNPNCPLRVALSLLKHLRVFDLAELTKNRHISIVLRQKIELMLTERIPSMPSGVKSALAKKANSTVVLAVMQKGDSHSIHTCLESPALTEGHIIKVINKPDSTPLLIKMIAAHPKWSLRYDIRLALIRNFHTPTAYAASFIEGMKTPDLKTLYSDLRVPASTRPFIYRELLSRNQTTEVEEEETFEIEEE